MHLQGRKLLKVFSKTPFLAIPVTSADIESYPFRNLSLQNFINLLMFDLSQQPASDRNCESAASR